MKTYAKIVYPFLTSETPKDFMDLSEVQNPGFKPWYHHTIATAWNESCNSSKLITDKHCE